MSRARALIVVLVMLASAAIARGAASVPPAAPNLAALPYAFGAWTGAEAAPLDAETRRILAADEVLNRTYVGVDRAVAGLYVAYYAKQRPGVSIHSPLHCLPGTGWEPLDVGTANLGGTGAAAGAVRRMIVRRGNQTALVLYWYSLHGRIIANEFASKLTQLADSVRLHRSDAALVRVVVPVGSSLAAADAQGLAFARDLAPRVDEILNTPQDESGN